MTNIKDLTHFCEELDELHGKEGVMADLSRWISEEKVDIFWRQNTDRYPSFAPVARPAPDMLIDGIEEVYAVCVVHGDGSSEKIREAFRKAVNIWERMATDPPDYDQTLSAEIPSAVLVATEQSPNGHLFSGTKNREHPVKFSEDRKQAADLGILPQSEFAATQEVIRSAWGFAKDREESGEIGVGALLSSRLENKEDKQGEDPDPAALYYLPGESQPHRWEAIPWVLWN
jgi:hypothetical protein